MKIKNIVYQVLLCGLVFVTSSCESFLDFAPEADLDNEKVFTSLENVTDYFSPVYTHIRNRRSSMVSFQSQGWNINELTDASTPSPNRPSTAVRNGSFTNGNVSVYVDGGGNLDSGTARPILFGNFRIIRICNNVIRNADRIEDSPTPEEIADLKGQAYFIRGYAYFQICRLWGGMPYLTHVLTSEDEWDRPRLTAKETYKAIALDMDSAYTCFKEANRVRRDFDDPLNESYKINLPNGCAALALKSRALLYAASPLSNVPEERGLWEEAAKAASKAINEAEDMKYDLLPIDKWLDNTYGVKYTNEQIWAYNWKTQNFNWNMFARIMTGVMTKRETSCYAMCPTQNFVDRYETAPVTASGNNDGYSYSLLTEEDRNKAKQAGVYDEAKPYEGLDKRFYHTIFYNGAPLQNFKSAYGAEYDGKVNVWRDGDILSDHIDTKYYASVAVTGYMQKRLTGDLNQYFNQKKAITDPLFLLSELYLNYAEAANEAGGPDYKVEGARYTSYQALMKIRERAKQGPLRPEEISTPDVYKEKIKNERCIELAYIGHYYYDTYRWKDAPKRVEKPLMKMTVNRKADGSFEYKREELESEHQCQLYE